MTAATDRSKSPATLQVSVCITVSDGEAAIGRSIESVLEQTYPHFECIVVDDNSTDGTAKVAAEFADPRIRLMPSTTNLGVAEKHNKFICIARDEVEFVHGDDWLLSHYLERLVAAFDMLNVGPALETVDLSWKRRYGRLDGPSQPLSRVNGGPDLIHRFLVAGGRGNPIGELGWPVRLRALTLWLRSLARACKKIVDVPKSQRHERVLDCATNVRYVATGQRLRFGLDPDE